MGDNNTEALHVQRFGGGQKVHLIPDATREEMPALCGQVLRKDDSRYTDKAVNCRGCTAPVLPLPDRSTN